MAMSMRRTLIVLASVAALTTGLGVAVAAPSPAADGALQVSTLTADGDANPLGVDVARPRLAWLLSATTNDATQSAYQVQVATSDCVVGTWDGCASPTGPAGGVADLDRIAQQLDQLLAH
jgi:hypothetical protein